MSNTFREWPANKAKSVITLLGVSYLFASTGKGRLNFLPWHQYIQLGLDAFLLVIWIVSAALANITCHEACNACTKLGTVLDSGCGFAVFYGDTVCSCYFSSDSYYCDYRKEKRAFLDAQSVFEKRASSSTFRGVSNAGKLAVNIIELVLFVASLAATVYFIFAARRSHDPAHNMEIQTQPAVQTVATDTKPEQHASYPPNSYSNQPPQPQTYNTGSSGQQYTTQPQPINTNDPGQHYHYPPPVSPISQPAQAPSPVYHQPTNPGATELPHYPPTTQGATELPGQTHTQTSSPPPNYT